LGLPPTASAVAGSDALAENLFLEPGEHPIEELLAAADGGVWIGWLDRAECYNPSRVSMLTRARGVRRIRDGALAESLPDLRWEESLLGLLARPLRVAANPCCWTRDDGLFGGISAPSLGLSEAGGLLPAVPSGAP
ncbi:MAG TPA: metallopeptidase TldD-related protein, partial [Thermoanaerobaculia bacterium]|nr:metallopeptidase TldD-related protein [Thermoanaerobaculia bacterium]